MFTLKYFQFQLKSHGISHVSRWWCAI